MEEDKGFDLSPVDHAGFFYVSSIDIDDSGNILVLDSYARCLYKFDSKGNLIQTVKLRTSKNGEFDNLLKSTQGKDGRFYILEPNAIHVFNPLGQREKTISFEDSLFDFGILEGGQIIAGVRKGLGSREIALFSETGKKLHILYLSSPIMEISKPDSATLGIASHIYLPSLLMNVVDDKTVVYGHSSQYRLYVIDQNGDILRIVERDVQPEILSELDVKAMARSVQESMKRRGVITTEEEILRMLPMSQHKAYFHFILSDDTGFIYTVRLDRRNQTIDVFDDKGVYLERIQSPIFPIYKIADGFVYGLKRLVKQVDGVEMMAISRYAFRPRNIPGNASQDPSRK